MKLTDVDILPEEIYTLASPDKPNMRLTTEDVRVSSNTPIVVKYNYLDMGITPYHFAQEFTSRDTKSYFEQMKKISSQTINSLLEDDSKKLHFRRSPLRGNLLKAVSQLFPQFAPDMIIYHFALYTSPEGASRATGVRSPRIYFMHGTNGFIYPLFFDPFHELNPMPEH